MHLSTFVPYALVATASLAAAYPVDTDMLTCVICSFVCALTLTFPPRS